MGLIVCDCSFASNSFFGSGGFGSASEKYRRGCVDGERKIAGVGRNDTIDLDTMGIMSLPPEGALTNVLMECSAHQKFLLDAISWWLCYTSTIQHHNG
jgi:hypothetical protein